MTNPITRFKHFLTIFAISLSTAVSIASFYNMKKFNEYSSDCIKRNTFYIGQSTRQQKEILALRALLKEKNKNDKMNTAKYYADSWYNYQMLRLCHAAEAKY
jgi:hypothetical protein